MDYAKLLVSIGAVELRTDPAQWFTWSSGERAPIYCDNRVVISYPAVRVQIARGSRRLDPHAPGPTSELIAGTATAGIPHAAWVATLLDLPMVYVRGTREGARQGQARRGQAARAASAWC